MMLNYLKLTFRLLLRNPFFAMVNVVGLAIGFAAFFVLWHYSQRELNSDQFHVDWDEIVRLTFYVDDKVYHERMSGAHPAFEKQLALDVPELSNFTRLCNQNAFCPSFTGDHDQDISLTRIVTASQKFSFPEKKLTYADSNLFNFFTIPLISGDKRTVLKDPNSIVLSEKLALKYFGNQNPLGSMLFLNDSIPMIVTGVYENIPSNSHLDFEAVIPVSRIEKNIQRIRLADNAWFSCYFKLFPGTNSEALIKKIEAQKVRLLATEYEKFNWSTSNWKAMLQPLHEIAFERIKGDYFILKSRTVISIFAIISIVVLMMAWVNYINLTISANNRRLKEMAARLTVGARRVQFLWQFMTEAAVVNILSFLVALTLVQLLRTPAETIFRIHIPGWNELSLPSLAMIGVMLGAGILGMGIYPALLMMKRNAVSLFGNTIVRSSRNVLTNWMTILQFATAMVLVIWTFGVYLQLNFVLNKDLGFRKNDVIVVDFPYLKSPTFDADQTTFVNDISRLSGVEEYAISSSVAGDNDSYAVNLHKDDVWLLAGTNGGVDERFLPFYDVPLLAGRNFLPNNPGDNHAIIVSKRVVELLGISSPAAALGLKVYTEPIEWESDHTLAVEIIGVVDDYKRLPLVKGFQANLGRDMGIALTYGTYAKHESRPKKVSIRIDAEHFDETRAEIEARYRDIFQGSLFNWYFLDEHINRHYQNENVVRNQILLFTGLAVGIACLGLLGMMSNRVVEKTKEVGIRKVLGASLHQIAQILLNTTLWQLAIASLIGIPLAFVVVQKYLEKFTEQIAIQWWLFAVPLIMLLVILFITVAAVLWKSAKTNPVESLRYE